MEAEEVKRVSSRISAKQLDIMISYLETDENLRTGKLTREFNKATRKRKWQELSDVLNAEGIAIKTPDQWRKCWSDQKAYARSKALKLETSVKPCEPLTPVEERILTLIGTPLPVVNPTIVNVSSADNAFVNEDTLVNESESAVTFLVKEEIYSNESTVITQETTLSEESSPTELSSGPSLSKEDPSVLAVKNKQSGIPLKETVRKVSSQTKLSSGLETGRSAFVATSLQQPSKPLEATPSEVSPPTESSSAPSLPEKSTIVVINQPPSNPFAAINLQPPNNPFGCQTGFVPVILNPVETEKPAPVSSKDISQVNETLKQQLDVLKRIATANEQIAHACMILANKTEERTKELTLQNELIQDINQTLHRVVAKQKTNGDEDFL